MVKVRILKGERFKPYMMVMDDEDIIEFKDLTTGKKLRFVSVAAIVCRNAKEATIEIQLRS